MASRVFVAKARLSQCLVSSSPVFGFPCLLCLFTPAGTGKSAPAPREFSARPKISVENRLLRMYLSDDEMRQLEFLCAMKKRRS
jgi:uncharacterized membrane protein